MSRHPAPRPYHHGNLREALIDAATALLASHGAEGFGLRDVARAAGVSHAAPYHHFASHEDLLAAVAERGFDALAGAMTAAATQPAATPREALLAINDAYVGFACRQPALFRLMFGPLLARGEQFPALRQTAERSFTVLMQAAQGFDAEQGALLGLAGWSLAHGLASLAIDGALAALPMATPPAERLARLLAERLLPATPPALAGPAGTQR
ncbi:TetR/AcrR family transcriptional regulator [Aquabacterium sp.]|uniref:TetR/AcrR family transcriptional regulator n=1 Tax=Aquabacterium sp. TaxID=1872578 RepID=UPI0037830531